MADIASVSRSNLKGRRQKLRRHRRHQVIQGILRSFAVSGLAGGLLWMTIQPMWVLKTPNDIVTSGNELLSDRAIQSMLQLSYPQSLWRIEPSKLARSLNEQPTIAQASVSRRLFPPGLIVQVKERVPVAIAQIRNQRQASGNKKEAVGLLDASGVLMPLDKYSSPNNSIQSLSLKVIGSPEQYRPYWTQLYEAVSHSSIKVMEIDCQDPTNLILKTELGQVHLGVPSSLLPEQIKVMAQMRHLPTQLNPSQIKYIDLKNPDFPLVQMNQKKKVLNSKSS